MRLNERFAKGVVVTAGIGAFSVVAVQSTADVYNGLQMGVNTLLVNPVVLGLMGVSTLACTAMCLLSAYDTVVSLKAPRLNNQ